MASDRASGARRRHARVKHDRRSTSVEQQRAVYGFGPAFSGLRLAELLGLRWHDVDWQAQALHVRYQLDRDGGYVQPKTPTARRAVLMFPALAAMLREHRAASRYSTDFASRVGTPLAWRNEERRGLGAAANAVGLNAEGRPPLRLHDLRHFFASLLIAEGADPVFVSRQLGHASPAITMNVYAGLFDQHRHADATRERLQPRFGTMLEQTGGNGRQLVEAEIIDMQAFRN